MHLTNRIVDELVCRRVLSLFCIASICVGHLMLDPCHAEVILDPNGSGVFKVNGPSGRSREQVMQSFASWQRSVLESNMAAFQATPTNSKVPSTALWSVENGVLSTKVSDDSGSFFAIELSDLDLASLSEQQAGAWHIWATSRSDPTHKGFKGYLAAVYNTSRPEDRARDLVLQKIAVQALQDIYDLAYLAQKTNSVRCLSGNSLAQYANTSIQNNEGRWGPLISPSDGKAPSAQITYQVADLVHGPTLRGGQTIHFYVQTKQPINIGFHVDLTSNTGARDSYDMGENIPNPSGTVDSSYSQMSGEPFAPGECITNVAISKIIVKPLVLSPSFPTYSIGSADGTAPATQLHSTQSDSPGNTQAGQPRMTAGPTPATTGQMATVGAAAPGTSSVFSPATRASTPTVPSRMHDLSGAKSSKQPCWTDDCVATQDQLIAGREAVIAAMCHAWDPSSRRLVKPGGLEVNAVCDQKIFKGGGQCFLEIEKATCVVDGR